MTIICATAPGSASNFLKKKLEFYLNCKSKSLRYTNGIGNLNLKVPLKRRLLKKLNLNFLDKTPLILGHIFPTDKNMQLLNHYYNPSGYIITYRNIFQQLNYYYKWQKYNFRCPLSFEDEVNFIDNKKNDFLQNFNIDLNLILVLKFYQFWFNLIQKKKIINCELISFDEIVSSNENYQNKIKNILKDSVDFDKDIDSDINKNEQFEINQRHKKIINEFISFYKNIDFSLII